MRAQRRTIVVLDRASSRARDPDHVTYQPRSRSDGVDYERLDEQLEAEFDADEPERRVVTRQARDLVDSGQAARDRGNALTVDALIDHLNDAPQGSTLPERWNWWMGALDVAYGGYEQFTVRFLDDETGINR